MAWLEDILNFLETYKGQDEDELCEQFDIQTSSKSKNHMLVDALMSNYEGKILLKENLKIYNINVKTIQLNEKGRPKEAMSFAAIDFMKIINENWETSDLRNYLLKNFIFFTFEYKNGKNYLSNISRWNMPINDLDGEVKDVWEDTKQKVATGNIVKNVTPSKLYLTFKNEKSTNICHVRPHGASSLDITQIPVPDISTGYKAIPKQSFWFNHSYIIKIVNNVTGGTKNEN